MNNPFEKPLTLNQWLVSSGCWLISCVSGWLCLLYGLFYQLAAAASSNAFKQAVFFSGSLLIHGLIWKHVVDKGMSLLYAKLTLSLGFGLVALLWWIVLFFFQALCSVLLVLWLLAMLFAQD
jgi:hypothetical protein